MRCTSPHAKVKMFHNGQHVGEFLGAGCYALLPPSRHPHGGEYEWRVNLTGEVPIVDPVAAGFIIAGTAPTNRIVLQSPQSAPESSECSNVTTDSSGGLKCNTLVFTPIHRIERAVELSLPRKAGDNHSQLLRLAQALFAFVLTQNRTLKNLTAAEVREAIMLYYQHAKREGFLRKGLTLEDYEMELYDALERVKYPHGYSAQFGFAIAAAHRAPVPQWAADFSEGYRALAQLLTVLQAQSTPSAFILTVRQVQNFCRLPEPIYGTRRLKWFCKHGHLARVEDGTFKNRGSTWRLLHPLPENAGQGRDSATDARDDAGPAEAEATPEGRE
jgi:hypothetical protein